MRRPSSAGMWLICLLFFLSGISGLVYQVVWVREFGTVFGATVYSAATVSAVFMFGLGVGSFVVGRWADRLHRRDPRGPLRAYGYFELGIAALGLGIALVLPQLEGFSASLSSYETGPNGWHQLSFGSHALRFGIALVLLAPITLLMGGTLTLLIRHLVGRDLSLAGWRVGALYGLNTAGAALGAFASDFALIPQLGIFGAEIVAVSLNFVAGGAALLIAAAVPAEARVATAVENVGGVDAIAGDRWQAQVVLTAFALFCSGVAAMGMEILWLRYLISVLGPYRAVFSLLLTVILIGIFLGSLVGGYLERRTGRPVLLYLVGQAVFVVITLALLGAYVPRAMGVIDHHLIEQLNWTGLQGALLEAGYNLQHIVAMVGAPAFLLGCTFPLANAHVQRVEHGVGRRSGLLYLANTLGNVVGSLGTGLVLLPGIGTYHTVAVLMLVVAAGLGPLYWTLRLGKPSGESLSWRVPLTGFSAIGIALGVWSSLPSDLLLRRTIPVKTEATRDAYPRILALDEGINENLAVIELAAGRWLYTNGHPMSANSSAARRYMRLFAHLPLLGAERPRTSLVICFGVGNTVHAASLHSSLERLDVAELSENVLRYSPFFARSNANVLVEDPRVRVFVNDGRQHLRMQPPGTYDLITLEPPPLPHAGVSGLYSLDFYELARSRLAAGGYMTQWLPAYQVSADVALALVRAFLDAFPGAVLLSGHDRELILMGKKDGPVTFDLERFRRALDREGAVRADLRAIDAGTIGDLVGTFAASSKTLEAATAGVAPLTDDRPVMEYDRRSVLVDTWVPEAMLDPSGMDDWCGGCVSRDGIPELWGLPFVERALQAYYGSERFLHYSMPSLADAPWGKVEELLWREPCVTQALRESEYLSTVFEDALRGVPRNACPQAPGERAGPPS